MIKSDDGRIDACMDGKGRNVDMWMKTLVNLRVIIQNEGERSFGQMRWKY